MNIDRYIIIIKKQKYKIVIDRPIRRILISIE